MTILVRSLACLLAVLFGSSAFGQAPEKLFKAIAQFGPINPTELSGGINVKRFRVVQTQTSLINQDAASTARQSFGPNSLPSERQTIKTVNLNLFDNVSLIADFHNVLTSANKRATTWSGIIRGSSHSCVTITVTGRVVFGNVATTAGTIYEIRSIGGDNSSTQAVLQVEDKNFPKESNPLPIKGTPVAQDINPNAEPALLNVLVAYTPASVGAAGPDGIASLMQTAEAETNQGYSNSGVKQRIKIVSSISVQYDEKDGYGPTLQRLADPKSGVFEAVRSARAQFHADMVVLLIKNAQSCGLSYLAQPPTPEFASKAFSVVNIACATGYFSFGHELGHLQGCNHDRTHANGLGGAFPYSYGYQQTSQNPHFRDIMSYDCEPTSCTRINYWSNPQIQYDGIPLGEATDNNALTLNQTQYVAAGWHP